MKVADWDVKRAALGGFAVGVVMVGYGTWQKSGANIDLVAAATQALGGGLAIALVATAIARLRNRFFNR
jgi:hypothetical protein